MDSDCDGEDARCGPVGEINPASQADVVLTLPREGFGWGSLALASDINGDGEVDLVHGAGGAPGTAWVLPGPLNVDADITVDFEARLAEPGVEGFGQVVGAGGDVNGDGFGDLLLGVTDYPNRVYLVHGPVTGDLALPARADATLFFHPVGSPADTSMMIRDVNGDGFGDVVISSAQTPAPLPSVRIALGPLSGTVDLEDADLILTGPSDSAFGGALSVGDLNGDGHVDLVVGAPSIAFMPTFTSAYVYLGPLASGGTSSADIVITGPGRLGSSVLIVPDVTGDGLADLVIGAPEFGNGPPWGGAVFVYSSPTAASLGPADADVTLTGTDGPEFGSSLCNGGDIDGDGLTDLVLPSYFDAFLVYSPITSDVTLPGGADAWFRGSPESLHHCLGPVDANGDGFADVAVGSLGHNSIGATSEYYVIFGGP